MKRLLVGGLFVLSAIALNSAVSQTQVYLSDNSQASGNYVVALSSENNSAYRGGEVLGVVKTAVTVYDPGDGGGGNYTPNTPPVPVVPCQITAFTGNDVPYGSGAQLNFSVTSGCQYSTISGGEFNNQYVRADYTFPTYPIYKDTTFTLTAYETGGVTVSKSITTRNTANCSITSFTANDLSPSTSATLNYSVTSGCTSVLLNGGTFIDRFVSIPSGTLLTDSLDGSITYTLTAYDINGKSLVSSVVANATENFACNINSLFALTPNVALGDSVSLQYFASDCSSMTLSGGEFTNRSAATDGGLISSGPLFQTTTYNLVGRSIDGSTAHSSVTVVVGSS